MSVVITGGDIGGVGYCDYFGGLLSGRRVLIKVDMKKSSYNFMIMDIGSNMKRCEICGRELKSLGYARHIAMHRDEWKRTLGQMRKGYSTSMKPSID